MPSFTKSELRECKKTAAKSPEDKRALIMLGLADRYDINVCKRKLENRREGKRAAAKEVNEIMNMVETAEAVKKLKDLPPAPDEKINISKNPEGGHRTRTRTRRKTRKSHKRHKKRSTRRRR
jgi:hypothetical protein